MVYHNNFIGSTQHVECTFLNIWDNDYPTGGNYWSNYTGIDANNDGIGDTPHIIDTDNQDHYPLMHPWNILNPVHNINTGLSYVTIQEAINAEETLNGYTIFVEAGTYYENVVVNKTVSLIGESKETTIIDGNRTGMVVTITQNSVIITGFTVQNSGNNYLDAGIYLDNVNYCNISGNSITNNYCGIRLQDFSNCNSISGNNIIANNWNGILLQEPSNNNTISRNNITANHWDGISLGSSDYNIIFGNNITANGQDGVMLWDCSNNIVSGNNIMANAYDGIILMFSSNNTITRNTITNNGGGAYLISSSNNTIYHNNFINNSHFQAAATADYPNTWDDGYPSGGNYWSNYTGGDLFSGSYQNETGSDGIGDTPYVINANNRDNYPLMKPYAGAHDIGIPAFNTSKTTIGQGYCTNISVKIINYGRYTENFNVTILVNSTTMLHNQTVSLTSRNSATITFTWNTTDFERGNYTFTAVADAVPEETDTTDNTRESNLVQVGAPCDITGPTEDVPDGVCNMRDIGYICSKFGTTPSNPNWNANCDVTGPVWGMPDDIVNMRDIGEACNNFMKT